MPQKSILSYTKKILPGQIDNKIFFLHVPKCGGTSIIKAMQNNYGLAEVISQRHFFAISPEALQKSARLIGEDVRSFKERLLLYNMSQSRMKYISGHFLYSEKAMQEYGDEWSFVTLLRDPVTRWFSHYFMDRYSKTAPSFAHINLELEDFLHTEKAQEFALYYVLAFNDNLSIKEAYFEEAIQQAISNINKFTLVGILEKLDRFVEDYQKTFNANLNIPKLNKSVVTKNRQKNLITEDIKLKVQEMCQPSIKVYETISNLVG